MKLYFRVSQLNQVYIYELWVVSICARLIVFNNVQSV